MRRFRRFARLRRGARVWVAGGLFVLSGCDPQVRSTILTGLETSSTSLSQTFISAFFQKLQSDTTGTATST